MSKYHRPSSAAGVRTANLVFARVASEIEDCTQKWTFEPESFDYVHIRWMTGSIADWPELFKQAYRTLKPGGWLESYESSPVVLSDDDTIPKDSPMGQWPELWFEAGNKMGQTFRILEDDIQMKAMQAAGFVDVKEKMFKVRGRPSLMAVSPQRYGR